MKTIKVRAHLGIGLSNACREDIIEIQAEDGDTPEEIEEEIEEAVKTWMWNYIDWGWEHAL